MVRPKDSLALLNLMETGSAVEESRSPFQEEMNFNGQTVYSYQQISCLDSVVRYTDEDRSVRIQPPKQTEQMPRLKLMMSRVNKRVDNN